MDTRETSLDIESGSSKRVDVVLEQLKGGHSATYKGMHIQLQRGGDLEVSSYSDFSDPSYISVEIAKSGIATSKSILAALLSEQPVLSSFLAGNPTVYSYLCSYGMGAIAVAEERAGVFNWLLPKQPR